MGNCEGTGVPHIALLTTCGCLASTLHPFAPTAHPLVIRCSSIARPEYLRQLVEFKNLVFRKATLKQLNGTPLNGPSSAPCVCASRQPGAFAHAFAPRHIFVVFCLGCPFAHSFISPSSSRAAVAPWCGAQCLWSSCARTYVPSTRAPCRPSARPGRVSSRPSASAPCRPPSTPSPSGLCPLPLPPPSRVAYATGQ